jgi:hypothetical protein
MRIVDLRREARPECARVSATVIWEQAPRAPEEVWFECRGPASGDLAPSPDAFLLACAMPAMERGERRVEVEGAVCSELRNGLLTSFSVICHWFPDSRAPLIQATGGFSIRRRSAEPRVASFMSGGVDALATLLSNRRTYPRDHPSSIRDCLYLFGMNSFDFGPDGPVPERARDYERRFARLQALALEQGATLIPVYTNVRHLARDFPSWLRRGMGAGLSSVAHVFSDRISRALIGSSGIPGESRPLGTHPLLDPSFSSAAVEIRHDGLWLSRLEKTALIAESATALALVQCCQRHALVDGINCGRCNKCVRTMVHLAALGKLGPDCPFPTSVVTAETILSAPVDDDPDAVFLEQAIEPLEKLGRTDLADAIRERVVRYRTPAPVGWRSALAELDRRWSGGLLARAAGRLRGKGH